MSEKKIYVTEQDRKITPNQKLTIREKTHRIRRAVGWLLETTLRGLAGYIILVGKIPSWGSIVVIVVGIYMTASSVGLLAYHFIKAYDE